MSRWIAALLIVLGCDASPDPDDPPRPRGDAGSATDMRVGPADLGDEPVDALTDMRLGPADLGTEPVDAAPRDAGRIDAATVDAAVGPDGACAAPWPDLWQAATPVEGGARLEVALGEDQAAGACGGAGGADAILRFAPPAAGRWALSTVATSAWVDTLVYAVGCAGARTLEERACDDDASDRFGELVLDLEAGEELLVTLDSEGAPPAGPITLDVRGPLGPTDLTSALATYNEVGEVLGLRLRGLDDAGTARRVHVDLLDADGAVLAERLRTLARPTPGRLALDLTFPVWRGVAPSAVRVRLAHTEGAESNPLQVPVRPPRPLPLGAPCHSAQAFTRCGPEADCSAPYGADAVGSCVPATPPRVTAGAASLDREGGRLGLVITGADDRDDAAAVAILPRDAAGAPVPLTADGAPLLRPLRELRAEAGRFTAEAIGDFSRACEADAQAARAACLAAGRGMCHREGSAAALQCARARIEAIAAVEIRVVDAARRRGPPFSILDLAPPAQQLEGGRCDMEGVIGWCGRGLLCARLDPTDRPVCARPAAPCPERWPVVDLAEHPAGMGRWTYAGDTTHAVNLIGPATCGGGGPQAVHAFTVPADGLYRARLRWARDPDDLGPTPILVVRSQCLTTEPFEEFGCAIDLGEEQPLTVDFDEIEGFVVYLLVDGYTDDLTPGFAAPYTLEIEALE